MKKAIALISLVALFGCTEEEKQLLNDIASQKTDVFAISAIKVSGSKVLSDGEYKLSDKEFKKLLPDDTLPIGTKAQLENYAAIHGEYCGTIDTSTPICFDEAKTVCTPSDVKSLKVNAYRIDISSVKAARDQANFYPVLISQMGAPGLADLKITKEACK